MKVTESAQTTRNCPSCTSIVVNHLLMRKYIFSLYLVYLLSLKKVRSGCIISKCFEQRVCVFNCSRLGSVPNACILWPAFAPALHVHSYLWPIGSLSSRDWFNIFSKCLMIFSIDIWQIYNREFVNLCVLFEVFLFSLRIKFFCLLFRFAWVDPSLSLTTQSTRSRQPVRTSPQSPWARGIRKKSISPSRS